MSNSNGFSSAELQNGVDHSSTPAAAAAAAASNGHASTKRSSSSSTSAAQDFASAVGTKTAEAWNSTSAFVRQTSTEASKKVRSCFSGSSTSRASYSALPTHDDGNAPGGEDLDATTNARPKWSRRHPVLLRSIFAILGLLLLLVVAVTAIVLHLLLGTLSAPSADAQKAIIDSSILLKGPDSISLLNISDAGINVAISGRLGLDPDKALDLWLGEKDKLSAWKRWDRKWIEWAFMQVKAVKVEVGDIRIAEPDWSVDIPEETLDLIGGLKGNKSHKAEAAVSSLSAPMDLLSFHIDPLIIPFPSLLNTEDSSSSADEMPPLIGGNGSTPRTRKTLHPINLELLFKPASPAEEIIAFFNSSLKTKSVTLDLKVAGLRMRGLNAAELKREEKGEQGAQGGKDKGSRWMNVAKWVDLKEGEIRKRFTQKIPKLDNSTDTSHLLDLTGYEFFEIKDDEGDKPESALTSDLGSSPSPSELVRSLVGDRIHAMGSRALGIKAHAVAKNPLGKLLKGAVRYSLPFGVFLPVHSPEPPKTPGEGDDGKAPKKGDKHGIDALKKGEEGDLPQTVDSVLMAVVAAEPFELNGKKEFKLDLMGRVVPPPADALPPGSSEPESTEQLAFSTGPGSISSMDDAMHTLDNPAQVALSDFLSKFLRGEANTVIVHGGNPFLDPNYNGSQPPADLPGAGSMLPSWLDNVLRQLQLPISFPGSKVTDLIKNVSISDLQIHPHPFEKQKLLCDGTVTGIVDLPGQLSTVDVLITDLWPDIIVYNGKPPSMRHGDEDNEELTQSKAHGSDPKPKKGSEPEPAPPLPNPLPKHAFGRVRPADFTPARTYLDPEDPEGKRKLLHCELKNVPFEVLPGRGEDFRSFSWKLLTGTGALAGIEGSARAKIWNSGLGKLELRNLPVKGAFVVGQRGGGGGDDDDDGDDDRW